MAEGRAPHEVTGSGGARETEPAVWWEALRARAGRDRPGRARSRAISVAGQQHGLVVGGEDGRPLRPAVLWNDTRSAPDAERLREELGAERWAQDVGVVPVPSFTVTRWAWLRRTEPEVAEPGAVGPAAARLADRAPLRARRHRPRRRLGHGLVVDPRRGVRRRGARAAGRRARPRAASGRARPGRGGRRGRRRGRRGARPARGRPRGTRDGRQHGCGAGPRPRPRRAGDQPGHVGHRLRGDERARRRPQRHDRGLRRRHRRLSAAGRHAQLHPGRRPRGGVARPRPRGGGREHRGHGAALPRRRAHAQPAARGGNHHRPAPRHHPRAAAAGRLRGRGGIADRGARAARLGGLGTGRRRAGGADRRRSARARVAAHGGPPGRALRAGARGRGAGGAGRGGPGGGMSQRRAARADRPALGRTARLDGGSAGGGG